MLSYFTPLILIYSTYLPSFVTSIPWSVERSSKPTNIMTSSSHTGVPKLNGTILATEHLIRLRIQIEVVQRKPPA
ncbi:hypothetical protein F5Y02DRAFT_395089 [Annulohypoxylon stygium]|nr:hypothetical protein F5Y02DRAFT_395089 [Annulohypoxylon stygium]